MEEEQDTGTLEGEVARIHRARRRGLYVGLGTAALASVVLFVWPSHADRIRGFMRGEATLDGTPVYAPEHPMSEYAVGEIDFDRVHRELIPRWTIALGQAATSTTPYWDERADTRFEELAEEMEPDPNLSDLLAWTHDAVRHDPVGRAARLDYWLWSYNRYLDDAGVPWRLEASMFLREHRAVLVTRSYEILSDARAGSGERLRLIRRADRLSNVEGWLGRTGQHGDGAMVLMRRVMHFTVRHVWPSLDPALDVRRPEAERSWVSMVRGEVQAALDRSASRPEERSPATAAGDSTARSSQRCLQRRSHSMTVFGPA